MRRRGTAIVISDKGILVAAGRNKKFLLPGGGPKRGESRKNAAKRELYEETKLKTKSSKFLFQIQTSQDHKVFLHITSGVPRPSHEIRYVAWWKPGSKIRISNGTRKIIEKYLFN